jgi:hypothetical protein
VPPVRKRRPGFLTDSERESISRGLARGDSMRAIARSLGRAASTVSREVGRNKGPEHYRAVDAEDRAWERARRRKPGLLAQNEPLRDVVAAYLSATIRTARSISFSGYFLCAGMSASFQASALDTEPGAVHHQRTDAHTTKILEEPRIRHSRMPVLACRRRASAAASCALSCFGRSLAGGEFTAPAREVGQGQPTRSPRRARVIQVSQS